MTLKVLLPAEVLMQEEVTRIKAEAQNGWFGLLPRHVDFATALKPGILIFEPKDKPQEYLAMDHGILVKCGPEVSISTRSAVRGANLEQLKAEVARQFQAVEEREKTALSYELKLETELVRGLLEMGRHA